MAKSYWIVAKHLDGSQGSGSRSDGAGTISYLADNCVEFRAYSKTCLPMRREPQLRTIKQEFVQSRVSFPYLNYKNSNHSRSMLTHLLRRVRTCETACAFQFGAIHSRHHGSATLMICFWLTEAQMARLSPRFLLSHGMPRVDDKRVLSGIIFINSNGLRRRDASAAYGPLSRCR